MKLFIPCAGWVYPSLRNRSFGRFALREALFRDNICPFGYRSFSGLGTGPGQADWKYGNETAFWRLYINREVLIYLLT